LIGEINLLLIGGNIRIGFESGELASIDTSEFLSIVSYAGLALETG
jgi:hypothetical protein